jgi:hypothetical protein
MFKKFFIYCGLALITVLVSTAPSANASWKWGPTWTSPAASRYLYVWGPSWDATQEPFIAAGNISYDQTANSSLNISGAVFTSNATAFSNAKFKVIKVSAADWPWEVNYAAVTCRNLSCSNTATSNLTNIAYIFVNSHFSFGGAWLLQYYTIDLQTVITHEMGHAHGLGHPADDETTLFTTAELESVMTFQTNVTKRELRSDDISGLASIY